ncbi:DUF1835 domain-containing protein [Thalassospira sp. HF15]|uniref:DUF1835 domain-containing protein n=1 Tax=Thalassospira sp. HF15 TaxID=2722755 RepID=UPI001430D61B|nr:DUF1835 domain-containing protein [Thalassospira sp. HF15]NIY76042.1 DUF1835 domain-containing protein [Thalassospira sp. HF15]
MSASRTSKSDHTQNANAAPKPSARKSPIFDGRLNLEQQRKRAKELLRNLRAETPSASTRAQSAGHKISPDTAQLADAQLIIARENGFASWPKMKAHIDQITERNRQIANGAPSSLDTANTLHLRCGSDIRHGLKTAGFTGAFLEFSDPFCQGPVPDLPLDQFVQTRADFIAKAYDIAAKDALARSKREYGALATLGDFDHVVLWFEHDSYDQLILAFLLDYINATRPDTRLEVISVGKVPGIERFIGLGQLSPELLIWCWDTHRKPITQDMLDFGSQTWRAIRSETPDDLHALVTSTTSPLPHMIGALKRHLAELPDPETGLGLTQKLTLQIINDHGPLPVGKVFGHLMRSVDPLPYLGDLMFWSEIQWMMDCHAPLFTLSDADQGTNWAERIITLTDTGHETLSGTRNFLDNFTGTRWVGGIRISPSLVS